jgi:hypothetical protein
VATNRAVIEPPRAHVHFGGGIACRLQTMSPFSSWQLPLLLPVTLVILSWLGAVQVKLLM